MSRSYSTFRERQPFTDGWKEANHPAMVPSDHDHIHRPLILEAEEKQMPIIRQVAGSNGQTYVLKAEIIEHSIVPAPEFVPKYEYIYHPREEFDSSNQDPFHYPEQIFEELINKVQDEASRRPIGPPSINPWLSGPKPWIVQENTNRKYDQKKMNDHSPNRDRYNEPSCQGDVCEYYPRPIGGPNPRSHPLSKPIYEIERPKGNIEVQNVRSYPLSKPTDEIERPRVNIEFPNERSHPLSRPTREIQRPRGNIEIQNASKYPLSKPINEIERPRVNIEGPIPRGHPLSKPTNETERLRGNIEGPNVRSLPLSKPTNEINTAMEFLKEAVKPTYGNNYEKEKESNTNAYSSEATRVPKTFPLVTTNWRTGTKMPGSDNKVVKPKDYDSEEEDEEEEEDERRYNPPLGKFDGLKIANNYRGGENKPVEKKSENPKRNLAAPMQIGQTAGKKKIISPHETIDSREASRRCGKLQSRATEGEEYEGTITSKQALAKYNGALVPR